LVTASPVFVLFLLIRSAPVCFVLVNVQSRVSPPAIENVTALVVVLVERLAAGTVLALQSMLVSA
jgi:hypothetical protein